MLFEGVFVKQVSIYTLCTCCFSPACVYLSSIKSDAYVNALLCDPCVEKGYNVGRWGPLDHHCWGGWPISVHLPHQIKLVQNTSNIFILSFVPSRWLAKHSVRIWIHLNWWSVLQSVSSDTSEISIEITQLRDAIRQKNASVLDETGSKFATLKEWLNLTFQFSLE